MAASRVFSPIFKGNSMAREPEIITVTGIVDNHLSAAAAASISTLILKVVYV